MNNLINLQIQPANDLTANQLNISRLNVVPEIFGHETGVPFFDDFYSNYLELHSYDEYGNLIRSDYNVTGWSITPDINNGYWNIEIDVHNNMRNLGLSNGVYIFKYALLKKLLGDDQTIRLSKISDSRKEILVTLNSDQIEVINAFNKLTEIKRSTSNALNRNNIKRNLTLNFGDGQYINAINWKLDTWTYPQTTYEEKTHAIIYKLDQPLPEEISVGSFLSVSFLLSDIITNSINLISENQPQTVNVLAGPNLSAKTYAFAPKKETGYRNFTELIGTTNDVSSKIINKYFSGSSVELNVDYSNFENFIFYSSAERRIENFKYKIKQIETNDASIYLLQSAASASVTGSESVNNNINYYINKKNQIIGTFDQFENYMYYQSSSYSSGSFGIQYSNTWPKRNDAKPYELYSYTSSQVDDWYDEMIFSASFYDKNNINALKHTVPEYVHNDEYSENYIIFVDMIAQHFDNIWIYVKNAIQILNRDENIFDGLSKDLVYYVLRSYGWDAENDHAFDELWRYSLGTDVSGSVLVPGNNIELQPSQSLIYVQSQSLATQDINKEIWKRILNNLPYLLKTKGSVKGMQAILNIYGVPSTILRIREYGGPEPTNAISKYKYNKFNYALELQGNAAVLVPKYPLQNTLRTPDSVEFRFKTVDGNTFDFPTTNYSWSYQSLYRTDNGDISFNIERIDSTYGNLTMTWMVDSSSIYHGKVTLIESASIFDNNWWSLLINKTSTDDLNASQSIDVYLKRSNYAELTQEFSSSVSLESLSSYQEAVYGVKLAYVTSSIWRLGGGAAGPTGSIAGTADQSYLKLYPFTGSIQEFRYWANQLNETAFDNHVTSPLAHNFSYATGSFDNLSMRLPLGSDLHYSQFLTSSYIHSIHPNQNVTQFANNMSIGGCYYDYSLSGYDYVSNFYINHGYFESYNVSMSFEPIVEEYALDWPDMSGNRSISNKIRIDDNVLYGTLDTNRSRELSAYDLYPLDTPRLGVYFSPTNEVDENIAEYMGGVNIDDYIGDYNNIFENEYSGLTHIKNYYFKHYLNQYGVIDYIRLVQYFDQSMWQQIKRMAPARAALDTGLVIEPHMLNRSKINVLKGRPSVSDLQLTASINCDNIANLTGSYIYTTASIDCTVDVTSDVSYNEIDNNFSAEIDVYEDSSNINHIPLLINHVTYHYETTGSGLNDLAWATNAFSSSTAGWDAPWNEPMSGTLAPDNIYTTAMLIPNQSSRLVLHDYNLNIPTTAKILGITVSMIKSSTGNGIQDYFIGLDKTGTGATAGGNRALNSYWSLTPATYSYGSPTDLWDQSWTPSELMSPSFSVIIQASASYPFGSHPVSIEIGIDAVGVSIAYQNQINLSGYGTYSSSIVGWAQGENDLMYSQDVMPVITASRQSTTKLQYYYSSSISESITTYHRKYVSGSFQDYLSAGQINHKWNGSKLVSKAFNVPSTDTIDGGPVVEYYRANPNSIIVNNDTIFTGGSSATNLTIE